jgi:hypothetical protein
MEILQSNIDSIILIVLSLIGIIIIIYNLALITKGQKTNSWNETNGIITKSEIEISKSLTKQTFENHYRADIEYEYKIKNEVLHSKQVFLGDKLYLPHKDRAEKTLNTFPINQTVKVYYNPDNNSESILIKGSGSNRFRNIILGLILIIVGVIIQSNFEYILNLVHGLE